MIQLIEMFRGGMNMKFVKLFFVMFISSFVFVNFCNAENESSDGDILDKPKSKSIMSEVLKRNSESSNGSDSTPKKNESNEVNNEKTEVKKNENVEKRENSDTQSVKKTPQENRTEQIQTQSSEPKKEHENTQQNHPHNNEQQTQNQQSTNNLIQTNPDKKKVKESTKKIGSSKPSSKIAYEKPEKKEPSVSANEQVENSGSSSLKSNTNILPDVSENEVSEFTSKMPSSNSETQDKTEYILKGLISMALVIAGAILLVVVIITGVNGHKKSMRNKRRKNYKDYYDRF